MRETSGVEVLPGLSRLQTFLLPAVPIMGFSDALTDFPVASATSAMTVDRKAYQSSISWSTMKAISCELGLRRG